MSDSVDIKFTLLPPRLQMQLWVLALDANTGKVAIAYQPGAFRSSLAYNYGGNVEASLGVRRFSTTLGVNPSNGDVDLGLVYQGFRFGTSASVSGGKFGISLSYGESLLPFPDELAKTFNAAGSGLPSLVRDIDRAPDNPLAWYRMHSDDVGAVNKAVSLAQQIQKHGGTGNGLGAGLRLNYSQASGLTIYGGVQMTF